MIEHVRVSTTRPCPACEAQPRAWRSKNGYSLAQCRTCGAIVALAPDGVMPAPTDVYSEYHAAAGFVTPEVVEASLDRLASFAAPYRTSGAWLDLGFGEGSLLDVAERRGWTCFGTEVSPQALDHGSKRGWTVTVDPERDPRFERASFDVVTLIEVLEHVLSPRSYLRDAVRWLRPGGLLYLTTPNARSLNRRLLGTEWSIFCPPEHLCLMTRTALHRLLPACDLANVDVRAEGFNPAEVRARLARPRSSASVNRQAAGLALNQALSRSAPRRMVKGAVNALLNLVGAGDTLKARGERVGLH
jgi:SAM-dependent methyltransferase